VSVAGSAAKVAWDTGKPRYGSFDFKVQALPAFLQGWRKERASGAEFLK
jgi:hypothetical protein